MKIQGIHHVTAITADVQRNINFYTGTLGLRLVKLTVNYDDPASYHLYYGDGLGRPGTILTFFGWATRRGSPGTGQVSETAFTIPQGTASWWETHLAAAGVHTERARVFDEETVRFADPDGLALSLVETKGASETHAWAQGGVPVEYAIRGFHGVTLAQTDERLPAQVLVDHFGYTETGREATRIRYQADGQLARIVDVVILPERTLPRMGAGQVHHVAFRTPDDAEQLDWQEKLLVDGYHVSPVMDRDYFHSIYFREKGGVLFEIATDGPGMTINEPAERLGTRLMLPRWIEPQRAEVEAALPPVKLPEAAVVTG